jgi:hypothetical protein
MLLRSSYFTDRCC